MWMSNSFDILQYGVDINELSPKLTMVSDHWGDRMPMMAMEELAECSVAISKMERDVNYGTKAREDLLAEISDVYISLFAISMHYDIKGNEIEHRINEKLAMDKRNTIPDLEYCIENYGKEHELPQCTVSRITHGLLRNDICSITDMIYIVNKKYEDSKKWDTHYRYIGPKLAEIIEGIVAEITNC